MRYTQLPMGISYAIHAHQLLSRLCATHKRICLRLTLGRNVIDFYLAICSAVMMTRTTATLDLRYMVNPRFSLHGYQEMVSLPFRGMQTVDATSLKLLSSAREPVQRMHVVCAYTLVSR